MYCRWKAARCDYHIIQHLRNNVMPWTLRKIANKTQQTVSIWYLTVLQESKLFVCFVGKDKFFKHLPWMSKTYRGSLSNDINTLPNSVRHHKPIELLKLENSRGLFRASLDSLLTNVMFLESRLSIVCIHQKWWKHYRQEGFSVEGAGAENIESKWIQTTTV
jgi:hypothetical protein